MEASGCISLPAGQTVVPSGQYITEIHLSNPQGQTHSANYFKVNSLYCLRKEFALAVFFCNLPTFLLRKLKTISPKNIFLSGQLSGQPATKITWTTLHLFLGYPRLTVSNSMQDVRGSCQHPLASMAVFSGISNFSSTFTYAFRRQFSNSNSATAASGGTLATKPKQQKTVLR